MKKLVLAALLATFAAGASTADKISFGVSATYPPFESLGMQAIKLSVLTSTWQRHCANKCRLTVLSPIMLLIA